MRDAVKPAAEAVRLALREIIKTWSPGHSVEVVLRDYKVAIGRTGDGHLYAWDGLLQKPISLKGASRKADFRLLVMVMANRMSAEAYAPWRNKR